MNAVLPLDFIREKIQDLQSALVFPETNAVITIPNYVIHSVQTDDQANIWFVIQQPALYMEQDEWLFPCRMEFFKKGRPFFLKVFGLAMIMGDNRATAGLSVPSAIRESLQSPGQVAIRLRISTMDYQQLAPPATARSYPNKHYSFAAEILHKLLYSTPGFWPEKTHLRTDLHSHRVS